MPHLRVESSLLRSMRRFLLCAALPLVAQAGSDTLSAPPSGTSPAGWSFSGFGTLAATQSSSPDAYFLRDLTQREGARNSLSMKTDSMLGGQLNVQLDPTLEGVVQAVSRYRHDSSFSPEITAAYLRYDPNPTLSLRAGRLGTEFFMLADSRQISYSYLTVRPVQDYFIYLPFQHSDGVDAAITEPFAGGLARAKLYYGLSHEKLPSSDQTLDLAESRLRGGYIEYLRGPWQTRLSYAEFRFQHELPGLTIPQLSIARKTSDYLGLGVVYDNGPWQVQAMLNRITHDSRLYQNANAAYVLAGYRIEAFTPYLGYSQIHSNKRDLSDLPPAALPVGQYLTSLLHAHQRTAILGLRWDFASKTALKLQWDAVRGQSDSTIAYRGLKAGWNGKTDVVTLSVDFLF